MKRTIAAVAALALIAAAVAAAKPSAKTLNGTVGPGFTISLKQNGKSVKHLAPGTYTFKIADKANIHSFVVEKEKGSPKFEKELTSVSFVGSKTVTVKLTKGSYSFYCAPHESMMHGDFTDS
jgi:plastocyanin